MQVSLASGSKERQKETSIAELGARTPVCAQNRVAKYLLFSQRIIDFFKGQSSEMFRFCFCPVESAEVSMEAHPQQPQGTFSHQPLKEGLLKPPGLLGVN